VLALSLLPSYYTILSYSLLFIISLIIWDNFLIFLILLSIKTHYWFCRHYELNIKFIIHVGTPSIILYVIMETIISISHHILYYLYHLLIFLFILSFYYSQVIYTFGSIFTRGLQV